MELHKVPASPRQESGKGASNRLRRAGKIPAVAYGKELKAESLSVSPEDVVKVLKSALGKNTPMELVVEGGASRTVMLREYQYHPVTRALLHADFELIHLDRPVTVEVPFEVTGKPKGALKGGQLHQVFRSLPVVCLPAHIPAKISVDVTELDVDDTITPSGLQLPEGVRISYPATQTLVAVVTESKRRDEDAEATPAAGAAAAPAAKGAAAKPAAAKPAAAKK